MSNVWEEDDNGLERRISGSRRPVLVDLWAEWCGPCKKLSPIIEELAGEHTEIEFVKVDADANGRVLDRYNVRGIPTLLLFADGEMVGTRVGAASKQVIEEWMAEILR